MWMFREWIDIICRCIGKGLIYVYMMEIYMWWFDGGVPPPGGLRTVALARSA